MDDAAIFGFRMIRPTRRPMLSISRTLAAHNGEELLMGGSPMIHKFYACNSSVSSIRPCSAQVRPRVVAQVSRSVAQVRMRHLGEYRLPYNLLKGDTGQIASPKAGPRFSAALRITICIVRSIFDNLRVVKSPESSRWTMDVPFCTLRTLNDL